MLDMGRCVVKFTGGLRLTMSVLCIDTFINSQRAKSSCLYDCSVFKKGRYFASSNDTELSDSVHRLALASYVMISDRHGDLCKKQFCCLIEL